MAQTDAEKSKGKNKNGAKKAAASSNQPNALTRYFRETRGELRKVTWPTRQESWRLTWIVIVVMLVFALVLGFLDFGFSFIVQAIVDLIVGS